MPGKAKDRQRKRRAHAQAATAKRRTPGQAKAAAELRDLADRHPQVLAAEDLHVGKGRFHARLRIATHAMSRVDTGLPISPDYEEVELWFGDTYPNHPPTVLARHDRFAGYPHVLIGRILCIFLDIDREWHPALGIDGVIARLIDWIEDAAADRFDSRTALFHPIGGLPPSPRVAGTLVVRQSSPTTARPPVARATIDLRSPHRSDLIRWGSRTDADPPSATSALVLRPTNPIPLGLVQVATMGELVTRVEQAGGPTTATALAAAARILPHITDETLRVVVEVAHPAEPALTYLACALGPMPKSIAHLPTIANHLPALPIGWTAVSDERAEIATRRDHQRPTAAFTDKSIELWGCGGLGSWMAEFIARAGAKRLVLRDTGAVTGGLLVRQNYTEDDIGLAKASRLATRLRAIGDGIEVIGEPTSALDVLAEGYTPTTDLLIDATINITVAARLDEWARTATTHPLIAQVATDPRSATLGMLIIASPDAGVGPATIDDVTWEAIRDDPTLERFHGFWAPLLKSEQVVPALGCSTPTFHGSAADLACLAGSLVSLLAGHIGVAETGTHLIESSHARGPVGGGHHFIAGRSANTRESTQPRKP
ncbi:MAG: ThiF family adenylyltransferase [Acidimicrobiia bacterium]